MRKHSPSSPGRTDPPSPGRPPPPSPRRPPGHLRPGKGSSARQEARPLEFLAKLEPLIKASLGLLEPLVFPVNLDSLVFLDKPEPLAFLVNLELLVKGLLSSLELQLKDSLDLQVFQVRLEPLDFLASLALLAFPASHQRLVFLEPRSKASRASLVFPASLTRLTQALLDSLASRARLDGLEPLDLLVSLEQPVFLARLASPAAKYLLGSPACLAKGSGANPGSPDSLVKDLEASMVPLDSLVKGLGASRGPPHPPDAPGQHPPPYRSAKASLSALLLPAAKDLVVKDSPVKGLIQDSPGKRSLVKRSRDTASQDTVFQVKPSLAKPSPAKPSPGKPSPARPSPAKPSLVKAPSARAPPTVAAARCSWVSRRCHAATLPPAPRATPPPPSPAPPPPQDR